MEAKSTGHLALNYQPEDPEGSGEIHSSTSSMITRQAIHPVLRVGLSPRPPPPPLCTWSSPRPHLSYAGVGECMHFLSHFWNLALQTCHL